MIPWLFPLAIVVLVIAFALTPGWVAALVAVAIVLVALLGLRTYLGEEGSKVPGWMSGWRWPR